MTPSTIWVFLLALVNRLTFTNAVKVKVFQDAVYDVEGPICSHENPNGACPLAQSSTFLACKPTYISYNSSTNSCILPIDTLCVNSRRHQQYQCRYPLVKVHGEPHSKALFPGTNSSCGMTDNTFGDCPSHATRTNFHCDPQDPIYNADTRDCVSLGNLACQKFNGYYHCQSEYQKISNFVCGYSYWASHKEQCPVKGQKLELHDTTSELSVFYWRLTNAYHAPEDGIYDASLQACIFPSYSFECQHRSSRVSVSIEESDDDDNDQIKYTSLSLGHRVLVILLILGTLCAVILYFIVRRKNAPEYLPGDCIVEQVPPMAIPCDVSRQIPLVDLRPTMLIPASTVHR